MTIVTQENDLINYATIKRISVYAGDVDDEEGGKVAQVYSILAFDFDSAFSDDEDNPEDGLQIGVFANESECTLVMNDLIKSIADGKSIFRIPQPSFDTV